MNDWLRSNFPEGSVEDYYSLSPVQEGMHLHVLRQPRAAMFFQQLVMPLRNIDPDLLIQAWEVVVKRHTILRTSFHWQGLDEPVQVVHREVKLPVERLDWSNVLQSERQVKVRSILRDDRRLGFDLSKAPLLRIKLINWGDGEYSLIKSHHHILLDGWSGPIVFGEVQEVYRALYQGRSLKLPKAPPFRTYIDWLKGHGLHDAECFWSSYLSGFHEPTPLPGALDVSVPSAVSLDESLSISAGQFNEMKSLAQRLHVTPGILVEAAWALLLSLWSDEEDVVFGATFSGRSAGFDGIERTVGLFINVLPIRINIRPNQRLDEWFKEINGLHYQIHAYDFTPPAQILSWSGLSHGVELFETGFTYNSQSTIGATAGGMDSGGGSGKPDAGSPTNNPTNHALTLVADEIGDELVLELNGVGKLYTTPVLLRLLEQMRLLLATFVADSKREVGSVSLMTAQDWQQAVYDWNKTDVDYPKNKLLHEVFEDAVVNAPDATAILYSGKSVTFGTLNRRANQLAHYLRDECGVLPGVLVGISLERSVDMIVALLSVLKTGGAYVPLDPDYPQARLELLVEDSGLSILLTEQAASGIIPVSDVKEIFIDVNQYKWNGLSTADLQVEMNSENLALVIYTSGSTGLPKGVALPHRVLVNRLYTDADPLEASEVLSAKTSLNFIDSIWELFFPWLYKRPTLLLKKEMIQDPDILVHALAEANVSRMVLVPSLMRTILESNRDLAEQLPCLKHLICSGEPLPGDLVQLFHQRLPGRVLTNLYGTSETWDVTRSDTRGHPENEALHIGRPMGNCQVYILDHRQQPVPIGMPGELCVAGQGLAKGYYGHPELTAERFVKHSFCDEQDDVLYRTGDRARWRTDGQVEFLGRVDFQLKIRGFRVEPGEVESILRGHLQINNVVVTGARQQLFAYVVVEKGAEPTVSELRDFSRKHLPEHLVPGSFIMLDSLPLTPSGKVDRRALPDPELQDRSVEYVAPRTEIEKTIVTEWESILQIDHIGIYDSFFDLGGHSLLATRIISRLRSVLEMNIPIPALFQEPTVAGLAEWIENGGGEVDSENEIPLEAAETVAEGVRIVPQSFAQQRMWFLSEVSSGSALYNLSGTIPFMEDVDPELLQRSLSELSRRHESLRTTFASRDGEPVQIIAEAAPVAMEVVDLRQFPPDQRRMQLNRLRQLENSKPFDLAQGPVVRYKLVVIAEGRHVLLYAMHHIITDGWSMAVFIRELRVIYTAYKMGNSSPLPEPKLQYADFATWQRNWLKEAVLERQIDYWHQRLDGAAHLELPVDRRRRATPRYVSAQVPVDIPASLLPALRELAQHESATLFMLMLTAFQFVLGRNAGQDDVVVGTPVANRTRADLEGIIGFFVNTLVMRTDLSGRPSFRELLRRVRETCLGAYNHQDLPFERVVEELAPQRELNIQPLFQVLFVLQNTPTTGEPNAQTAEIDVSTSSGTGAEGLTFYDITLSLTEEGDQLSGELHYNTDLFDVATAERFRNHLLSLLTHVAEDPDRVLSHEFLIDEGERSLLLSRALASTKELPTHCVHEAFEEVVDQMPDHTALVFDDRQLSYRELDHLVNKLAHELISRGVEAETTVGLCVDRGIDAIVGLLAILKAGGTYVPLNPELPCERLGWMIEDAAPVVILTQDAHKDTIADSGAEVLTFEALDQSLQSQPFTRPAQIASLQDLAYIIYTSGSTGKPKGVMIEHHSLCHTIMGQIPLFGITSESRVLSTIALSFDASLGEIFRTLLGGATLYLAPREQLLPGPDLICLLRDNHITTTTLVPSALAAMPTDERLPDLTTLTVGGEALSSDLALRWGKDRRLLNGYGPTEATIGATLATDWPEGEVPPLGYPLPGVYAYVLNSDMELLPDGVSGELCLGGPGLARGYLNQPGLTDKSFLPNPFSDEFGARLYRTGDRVRWRNDGQLSFLGRIDEQVKIRGHRIEPGEISSTLEQRQDIKEAVVIASPDHTGGQRLVAYVVLRVKSPVQEDLEHGLQDDEATASDQSLLSDLRQFLRGKLPDYMVPALFVVLDSLPLTPHGKLDRKALPEPADEGMIGSGVEYAAPANEVEIALAEIWGDLLRLERVGVNDNFFELGGDSILSIRVIARAAEADIVLTPMQVYQNQTVKEQAAIAQTGDSSKQIDQGLITGPVPLTPIQSWYFSGYNPEPHHFNWSTFLPAPMGVTHDELCNVMEVLLAHHDALRLRFIQNSEGGFDQHIAELGGELPVSFVDLSTIEKEDQRSEVESRVETFQTSLNLEHGPMIRLIWFELGLGHPGHLLLIANHLVIDAISWRFLIEDIKLLMQQGRRGDAARLPAKTASFKQWSEMLHLYAISGMPEAEREYWLDDRRWRGSFSHLTVDHLSGDNTRASAAEVTVTLDKLQTQRLTMVARKTQAASDEILLAAMGLTLARLSKCWRSLINVERHGREELGSELNFSRTVGWFPNISPVLFELNEQATLPELLQSAISQLRSIPNHGIGYGLLKYLGEDAVRNKFQGEPEAEVFFNYFGQVGGRVNSQRQMDHPSTGTLVSLKGERRHLIEINAMILDEQLEMRWSYSRGLHHSESIELFTNTYYDALLDLIACVE